MKRTIIAMAVALSICSCLCIEIRAQANDKETRERVEAQKAWDALVRVKGGREKLESINSILYTFTPQKPDLVRLQVLPYKVWEFELGWKLEPLAYMSDASKPIEYWADESGVNATDNNDPTNQFSYERVIYLLETRWEKPDVVRVSRQKIRRKIYDVVETTFRGKRIDFFYEAEEMLVTRVVSYRQDGSVSDTYLFSDYSDAGGVKMPRKKISYINTAVDNDVDEIAFRFNVDYDPDLFTRPLRATGPDAWQRKP